MINRALPKYFDIISLQNTLTSIHEEDLRIRDCGFSTTQKSPLLELRLWISHNSKISFIGAETVTQFKKVGSLVCIQNKSYLRFVHRILCGTWMEVRVSSGCYLISIKLPLSESSPNFTIGFFIKCQTHFIILMKLYYNCVMIRSASVSQNWSLIT